MNRLFCAALLLVFFLRSYAQLRVVDNTLKPIYGVSLIQESKVIGTSDNNGYIKIDTASIKEYIWTLAHSSFYPKKLTQSSLRATTTYILRARTSSFDPILITTDRGQRYEHEVPENVSSLSRKEIDIYQAPTAADLLQAHQTVYVQKSQLGGGSPMIRGFATNRILLVVDNVRMNTAIFRAGNVQNVISIDPYTVANSSVIFGPSSQFYGSDAIGGVISFETKDLDYSDSTISSGNMALRYGSAANEAAWHFDYGVSTKSFTSYSSISFSRFQDLRMGSNGPEEYLRPDYVVYSGGRDTILTNSDENVQVFTGYNQINALQKLKFKVNTQNELSAAFHFSSTSDIPRYDRLILRNNQGELVNGDWYYGPQKWTMTNLKWKHKPSKKWADSITTTLAYQTFEESRKDRRFGSDLRRERTENLQALSLNIDAQKSINRKLQISYGAEGIYNLLRSKGQRVNTLTSKTSEIASRYPDGSDWSSIGIYGHAYQQWNSKHISEAGIRLNAVQTTGSFDTSLTPLFAYDFRNANEAITGSISHLWKPKNHQIGIVLSTAFRSPNIDDISKVFDSNPGIVTVPNPDLKPEYAYNAELNYNFEFKDRIKLSTSLFYTYLSNALALEPTTLNGNSTVVYDDTLNSIQSLSNQDFATVFGAQIGVQLLVTHHWKLKTSYTILESTSSTDEPIRHITPNFGMTSLIFEKNRWECVIYSQYNQRFDFDQFTRAEQQDDFLYAKDENGLPYSPAWYTLNTRVIYQIHPKVKLNAGVENILDKRYRPYSSGITAPGRNFVFSLQAQI